MLIKQSPNILYTTQLIYRLGGFQFLLLTLYCVKSLVLFCNGDRTSPRSMMGLLPSFAFPFSLRFIKFCLYTLNTPKYQFFSCLISFYQCLIILLQYKRNKTRVMVYSNNHLFLTYRLHTLKLKIVSCGNCR